MKNNKKTWYLLLVALLVVGSIPTLPVYAGSSKVKIDKMTYEKGLDESIWHDADGDIVIEKNAIVFSNESTDATKLITKVDITRNEQLDTMLNARFTMKFSKLPEGETFVFGVGLSSLESNIGEEGNLEIAFSNNGKLKVGVSAYETVDTPTVLLDEKSCGSVGSAVKTEITLTTSGIFTLKINGATYCKAEIPVSGDGSVGFLQTGACGGRMTDLEINMFNYDRPENSDIFEDFESGDFNVNLFGSKITNQSTYSPCRIAVEEYNGNQVLMFKNVDKGYFATKQQYSNFELKFDMPYLQTDTIVDEKGEIVIPRFNAFGVSYGGDVGGNDSKVDFTGGTAVDLLLFMGSGCMGWLTKHPMTQANIHRFGDVGCEKLPSFKITVIDGIVTVQVKWIGEPDSSYETLLTYTIDKTPTGYIAIWAPSEAASSFAIDNISLKNMDKDAKLVSVEKISSKWIIPEDYDYQPMEKVYREIKQKETSTSSKWYLPIVVTVCSCSIVIGLTIGIVEIGKRKRKGGAEHGK